jgi:hypothetical protein
MKKVLAFALILAIVVSCNKDKFQSKPQITIKSTSGKVVDNGQSLRVELEYTDQEGDVDDTIVVKKERINQRRVTTTIRDIIYLTVPEFPNKTKAVISLDLEYQNHLISALNPPTVLGSNPPQKESDTLNLKFVLKDKGGNESDTVVLNGVVVLRN